MTQCQILPNSLQLSPSTSSPNLHKSLLTTALQKCKCLSKTQSENSAQKIQEAQMKLVRLANRTGHFSCISGFGPFCVMELASSVPTCHFRSVTLVQTVFLAKTSPTDQSNWLSLFCDSGPDRFLAKTGLVWF